MRAEIHRDGRWIAMPAWRLQRSALHQDDRLELAGYYGGTIPPPWRLLDDAGAVVYSNDERRPEERRSLVETDESPTTSPHSSAESRTT